MTQFFTPLPIVQRLSPNLGMSPGPVAPPAPPTAGHPGIMPERPRPTAMVPPRLQPPAVGRPSPSQMAKFGADKGPSMFDTMAGIAASNPGMVQQLIGGAPQQAAPNLSVQQYTPPAATFQMAPVNFGRNA